jgi:hypothetical protein
VTSFAVDGFTVLRDFLSPFDAAAIRDAVPALRTARAIDACERPNNTLVALRWDDMPVTSVLVGGARVRRVATATGGTDLRWTSGYLSIKDPHSGPLWWHQDWWCWNHPVTFEPEAPQVALLCYLDATTDTTGALRVLPGSHVSPSKLHEMEESDPDRFEDQPDQVTLAMTPGDAVVVDYRLLHGTHPNTGAQRRDCVILNFTPSWRDLPDDIRAHLIGGLALPTRRERARARAMLDAVLPSYDGEQRDLPLVRR